MAYRTRRAPARRRATSRVRTSYTSRKRYTARRKPAVRARRAAPQTVRIVIHQADTPLPIGKKPAVAPATRSKF